MNTYGNRRRLLEAAGLAVGLAGVPPTRSTVANPLADKLDDMAKNTKGNTKVTLDVEFDPARKGDILFSCSKETFLKAVGASKSGNTNGVTLTAVGTFDFEIGGKRYEFAINMGGGWTTVKAVI